MADLLEQSDYITCPNCGSKVPIAKMNRLGRKPLNIGVKNICDALEACGDIGLAAEQLGVSRGYIYSELAKHGMKPREVVRRQILDGEK